MNDDSAFATAVAQYIDQASGAATAQEALLDAVLLVLHDKLPEFTTQLIQHFEGIQPSASQHLDPAPLAAFYQRADAIRHRLDLLQRVPRRA